jgi:uncharacterized glyoxalase superfamily metalloenzyme YdcJ
VGFFVLFGFQLMTQSYFLSTDDIRTLFSKAMSTMYQKEVPQYGTLIDLVNNVNTETLKADEKQHDQLERSNQLDRLGLERHGAIRVGTAYELSTLRRLFAVMGMQAVGYYDLSVANVPVHSTAFRPVTGRALAINPFRVFTSLLRLELIDDVVLREQAQTILAQRQIFTPHCLLLINQFEQAGGLTLEQATQFVSEALYTFKWHHDATVNEQTYYALRQAHPLIADVVCFRGPHINHLTPRTLDIDAVQRLMPRCGIEPKQTIEGPPRRDCPILLRQTSFMALSEKINFKESALNAGLQLSTSKGAQVSEAPQTAIAEGQHTARFGEVEQRGIALTHLGRKLYDDLLGQVRLKMQGVTKSDYAGSYPTVLSEVFEQFPDNWKFLQKEGLGYFYAQPNLERLLNKPITSSPNWHQLIDDGYVSFEPITYEDFLPVSAAGIFQSNLGNENSSKNYHAVSNQQIFHAALGATVLNEFDLYAALEEDSIMQTKRALGIA